MANARLSIPFLFSISISILTAALAAGLGGSLAGCGGGGSTSTGGEGGGGGSTTSTGTGNDPCFVDGCFSYDAACFTGNSPKVSFKADVLPIFRTSCGLSSSCHGNENGPGGQHYLGPKNSDPDPSGAQIATIFAQSVGKMPDLDAGMNIVTPGDPEHSFMMYKLDGLACAKLACVAKNACGTLMPQGSAEPMPAAKRDIIRRWIAQGAKND